MNSTDIPHGIVSSYTNHACRCRECRDAVRDYQRRRNDTPWAKRCLDCGGEFPTRQGRSRRCLDCLAVREAARDLRRAEVAANRIEPYLGFCAYCTQPMETGREFCSGRCAGSSQGLKAIRRCTRCALPWVPSWGKTAGAGRKAKRETECWMCRSHDHVPGGRDHGSVGGWRRTQLLERAEGRCEDCGGQRELEAHHVVSAALGGSDALENLRLLCEDCHRGSGWARNHAELVWKGRVIPPVDTQLVLPEAA